MSDFFKKKSTTIVFSVVVAIISWLFVVLSVSPEDSKHIRNVPVTVDVPALSGFKVVEGDDTKVSVNVSGRRYNIGNLKADDIVLKATAADIVSPGEYELKVVPVGINDKLITINGIYPDTIKVKLDRILTKEIKIDHQITGVYVNAGENVAGPISISPEVIQISGPEQSLNKIVGAKVKYNFEKVLTQSKKLNLPLILIDENGKEIDVSSKKENLGHVNLSTKEVSVNVPIYDIVEIPLTLSFFNVPDAFPIEDLSYYFSDDYVRVAAEPELLEKYMEIPIGHIDLTTLDLTEDSEKSFKITLPENMVNCDQISTVNVQFINNNIDKKSINIKEINLINVPKEYDIKLMTPQLEGVKLIGDKSELSAISAQNVVAEIDFSAINLTLGQYLVPVDIYVPSGEMVWSVGRYQALVNVSAK